MARLTIPTRGKLPGALLVDPANAAVQKSLNRLSRDSLLALALDWLDESNLPFSMPRIRPQGPTESDEDEDESGDFYPPARSVADLRALYAAMQERKGSKREVVDRILEGDWYHGLSLYQLAMADLQYLFQRETSQTWAGYRILPLQPATDRDGENEPLKIDKHSLAIPRFHPSTFVRNLQAEVLPDVKAHYHLGRHKTLPIFLVRIFVLDSPYVTSLTFSDGSKAGSAATFESSRTIYLAFPDGSPFVYISKAQAVGVVEQGESKSLRSLLVEGIPKALSRPRLRYTLKSASLTTRNLSALLYVKGSRRTNAAGGGWSLYADDKKVDSPLDTLLPTPPLSEASEATGSDSGLLPSKKRRIASSARRDARRAKRAKVVAQARFGDSAKLDDGHGIERVDIRLEDSFPEDSEAGEEEVADIGDVMQQVSQQGQGRSTRQRRSGIDLALEREAAPDDDDDDDARTQPQAWIPEVKLTFRGSHVFAGIRQLVEAGIIDGETMPGWLTGEEGVTIGAVRHGRIRGYKGSGI